MWIKVIFLLAIVFTFSSFEQESHAIPMPEEVMNMAKNIVLSIVEVEEELESYDRMVLEDSTDRTKGTYINPANLNERIDKTIIVLNEEGDEVPISFSMPVTDESLESEAKAILGLRELLVPDNNEWIVLNIDIVIKSIEDEETTITVNAEDIQLFTYGSPIIQESNIYNDQLFQDEELRSGSKFNGKIARLVPRYTDFVVRFSFEGSDDYTFFRFIAEDDPNIVY